MNYIVLYFIYIIIILFTSNFVININKSVPARTLCGNSDVCTDGHKINVHTNAPLWKLYVTPCKAVTDRRLWVLYYLTAKKE